MYKTEIKAINFAVQFSLVTQSFIICGIFTESIYRELRGKPVRLLVVDCLFRNQVLAYALPTNKMVKASTFC
jgi:hypothetical protein